MTQSLEIIEQPKILNKQPDINYWHDKSRLGSKPQAIVHFTRKLLDKPLLRENLKENNENNVLKNLIVIRQPNATNYKIPAQDWQLVKQLLCSLRGCTNSATSSNGVSARLGKVG